MSRDAVIESWLASMSNSELIDQCFFYQDMALKHGRMYNALKDENAKLRELVRILAHCAAGHGCDICPINGGEGLINILDMCRSVHDHMRELRIEVD